MFSNNISKSKQDLLDLQSSQRQIVKKLLNLNKNQNNLSEEENNCVWKIIVFDKFCQDILSTLFKVFQQKLQ